MTVVMLIAFSAATARASQAVQKKIDWSKNNTAIQHKRLVTPRHPVLANHNAAHRIVNVKNKNNDSFSHLNR